MHKIVEEFYSLQGEGKYAGTAAYFIRFFGCNLACDFGNGFVCDDKAHSNSKLITKRTTSQLVSAALKSGTKHVVLTGGEVSLQDVNPLINKLKTKGLFVQVETNGYNLLNIASANYITYSPKHNFVTNAPVLYDCDELKVLAGVNNPVIPEDWPNWKQKYVQPIGNEDSWDQDNVNYCIEFVKQNPEWKLSLQTHKAIGVR